MVLFIDVLQQREYNRENVHVTLDSLTFFSPLAPSSLHELFPFVVIELTEAFALHDMLFAPFTHVACVFPMQNAMLALRNFYMNPFRVNR